MRYIMRDYVLPTPAREKKAPLVIHSSVCGNEGIFGIDPDRLPELLEDAFGDKLMTGSAVFSTYGHKTFELPVYYTSDRWRATDSFYGSVDQFMKEYIPEFTDLETEYPHYCDKAQVFVKETIVPFAGVSDYERRGILCCMENRNWGIKDVTGIRLDPRDDFTVEELLALGTSMETIRNSIVLDEH